MDFANPTFEQMTRHWFDLFCTNPSSKSFAHSLSRFFILQVGGMEGFWLIDSGCSRHMTRNRRRFSSLTLVMTKEYITFGDNGKGRVLSLGTVKVSESVTLWRVSHVMSLGYNLLSVSQLLDDGLEVRFKTGCSCVWDSLGDLVCMIIPEGQIFKADFPQSVGSSHCLVAGVLAELWKWHRSLGHLSFDLLSRLSGLGLVRGLPKLKYQKDFVCALCRHGKMVAASHPLLTSVMTERPCKLFYMDLVGPAREGSAGGKWNVFVIVDDNTRYAWLFFLTDKGETFGFVRDIILRLKNERNGDVVRAICSDKGSEFKNSHSETFCRDLGLEHQFSSPYVAC
jgi:hypothetical protein